MGRPFVLGMLAVLATLSSQYAWGQRMPASNGGYYQHGRYFGFVPKHNRLTGNTGPSPANSWSANPAVAPAVPSSSESSDVRAVSHDEAYNMALAEIGVDELPMEQVQTAEATMGGTDGMPVQEMICTNDGSCGPVYNTEVFDWVPPSCCAGPRWWGRAEYLHWATSRMDLPALATTSTAGTNQDAAGVLGQNATSILFGDEGFSNTGRSGGRFTIGKWMDTYQTRGWDITYVTLAEGGDVFTADETTNAILARPFFNTDLNAEDARLIAFPGLVEGSLRIDTSVDFHTLALLFRRAAMRSEATHVDMVLGYRYADLDDAVQFQESTTGLSGPANGTTIDLVEQFRAQNTFNGGQIGIKSLHQPSARWSLEMSTNFAVGTTTADIDISGQTTTRTAAGATTTTQAGLLAQGTNTGRSSEDEVGVITEFDLTLRRHLRCGAYATFGYSFLYWSDVYRASDQIDMQVNPTQIPPGTLDGNARPTVPFISNDFWAQGLHGGLEFLF